MYNCIYEDGTVIALPMGPCEPFGPSGGAFVDSYNEETVIDVIEPLPDDGWGWRDLLTIVSVLSLASFVMKRR